jgi:tetratricopeptide (TPR) repeat protein
VFVRVQLAAALTDVLALLRAGDAAAAAAACAELLERDPREPALHQLAATIALQRGEVDEAAHWAGSAVALRPDHAPTLVLAGRVARGSGKPAHALELFDRAMQADPGRPEAAFLACVCRLEQGDARAQELLAFCLKTFPDDAPGWTAVGAALQELRQPEAALAALTRAARAEPSVERHLRRGAALTALGRAAEAAEAFAAGLALDPSRYEAALQWGLALRQSGNLAGARAALERAAALDPRAARGLFALGLTAQDQRDWPAAARAYRAALAGDPDLAEAAVNLGVVLQESGDLDAAKDAYRRALALRADAFGRIAQALTTAPRGELWLDHRALRQSLTA